MMNMTLLRLVHVVELLFLLSITVTASSSPSSDVEEDETSSLLPHQHLRTAKGKHERSVIEMMGWNNDPSDSGETESEDEDDEKLNTEININFDTTPWWEKPTCEDDKLQLIMFLETDFTTANNNDEYGDYEGGILIYEHNSEEYTWFRNTDPIQAPINGSDQICLDDTPTSCYEIYYYYIGGGLFPNGGFYVDVDGTNLIDIRQNDLEATAGIYGRMEYFGSYYGNGCIDVYGTLYGPLDYVSGGASIIIANGGADSGGSGNDDDNSIAPESINDTRHCNDNPFMVQLDMEFQSDEWADEDNTIKLRSGEDDDDYIWKYEIGSFQKNKQYRWSTCVDQRECNIFEFHDEEGNLRDSVMKLYVDGVIVLDVDDDDDIRFFRQTPVQYTVDVGSC